MSIRKTLVDERPTSFEDCVVWARLKFETLFNNQIRQLLFNFPEDQVTSSGTKFWSGSKRCPKALTFDLNDNVKMRKCGEYVWYQGRTDEEYLLQVLQNVIVPDFTPKDGVKLHQQMLRQKSQKMLKLLRLLR
ncbi:hypothetical protein QTG54_000721 [Skeletonema marinoi]|uniref:Ubiquitin-activating enzyme SCCH domain-containing protein n=1 Tax=Skeletonema marinoi TaxID=267567 RepID=A0AAD9DIS6_9STRA|nr:hypothetical protein QTG54_000721 [Skeletonema marinoi]